MHPSVQNEEKKVPIRFLVPAVELEKIKRVLEALGGVEDPETKSNSTLTPWRELVKNREGTHSGRVLRGYRRREDMSQADLAEKINTKLKSYQRHGKGKKPHWQNDRKKAGQSLPHEA